MGVRSTAPWWLGLLGIAVAVPMAVLPLSNARAQGNRGVIAGVVRDSMGAGVSAAEVSLDGSAGRVLTDDSGAFLLASVPAGEASLTVRRLGFRPANHTVTVVDASRVMVSVVLTPVPTQLPVVQVRARVEAFDSRLRGFHARQQRGVGSFIDRERLEQLHSHRFTDVLRELPGVRIRPLRGGGSTINLRGASCDPLVFMDGFPAISGTVDLDMIDLWTVEAIEVYHGLASIPAEFTSMRGRERCGVVAIWSRPYRARPRSSRPSPQADLEQLVADRVVFTAEDVDSPAVLADGSATPLYPDSLWRAGVGGRVVAEFIVEPTGRVQTGSVRVISATHQQFAESVRRSLEEARFDAAIWQGRAVKQLVQLPVTFESPKQAGGGSSAN